MQIKNIILTGSSQKPIATDIFYNDDQTNKPVVIYAHGFNGFKDWGNTDVIAQRFAEAGFVFVKFNFSHNGTTPETPEAFTDLEAFGNNNYSKQLFDLNAVIDWAADKNNIHCKNIDGSNIYLIGHSMGGGITILQAARDERIKKLITWASVSECKTPWGTWPKQKMEAWKNAGVEYYINGRTKQNMPLYYQLHEDYLQNEQVLSIEKAIAALHIPVLICHGTEDAAVPVEKAYQLADWIPAAEIFTVKSDHVFGRKHPPESENLPLEINPVIDRCLEFFNKDAQR
jgi:uncharacterized protein